MKYIKTYEGLFDFFKKKETDPKKIEIIKLCKEYNITKYTINDDYSIDVDGGVDLSSKKLTKIPIKFNNVTGFFSCVGNQLVDLENAPRRVERNFMCQHQYHGSFVSLKGAPEYVGFRFDFNNNENLKDFTDFPTYVGATIDARSTGLYSFDCIPDSATKVFIDHDTPLFTVLRCVSSAIFPIVQRQASNSEIFIDCDGKSSEAIETFEAYDPIHPPKNEGDKPILYMDRFRMLLVEVEKKSVSNLLYSKDSDTYRMIEKHYDIRNNEYKIEEGLFDYFKKESKDKRSKIKEIKEGLTKLINGYKLRIDNNWGNDFKGNTQLNTKYGKMWININDDFTVDVYGNVGIRFGYDIKNLPCKFNKITGNFFIELSFSIDDFIDKFPERVEGSLTIKDCGLDSLKGLPTKYVGRKFDCSSNNLETLEGLPEHIGIEINAESNDIYAFDGLENYGITIHTYLNPIISVKFYDKISNDYINLETLIVSTSIHNRHDLKDRDSNLDIYKACDPIHPPLKKGDKPIIYLNRMEAFASELDIEFKVTDLLKRYYDVR
jgi:hypothetical protein